MELDVRLLIEESPGLGKLPESADEVLAVVRQVLIAGSRQDFRWRVSAVEPLGVLTHRVFASDGIKSVERLNLPEIE